MRLHKRTVLTMFYLEEEGGVAVVIAKWGVSSGVFRKPTASSLDRLDRFFHFGKGRPGWEPVIYTYPDHVHIFWSEKEVN